MIEHIKHFITMIPHDRDSLQYIVDTYQSTTYVILCLIIFCETGLVVTPFLPGDSLLFAAGVIASGLGVLNIYMLIVLIFIAAFAGDNSNYFIGNFFGPRVFNLKSRFIRKDYLDRTHTFYEKHGGKTIIIARFIPIIRTFAPFVAGIGSMTYRKFILFSIIGNLLWINSFLWAGYLLGHNEFVKNHFTQVTFGIIIVSLLPPIYGAIRSRSKR
ncbi:MAG TPA: VTT domain-containing protein [Bacteroidia bacterium]|nr:VTT domain-containing protein [Bacteroidia bacterium]